MPSPLHPMAITYRTPQSLQVAGEGLELAPVLIGLLLGHAQGLCMPGSRIRQICKLGGDTHVPWDGTTWQGSVLVAHGVGTRPSSAPREGRGPSSTWHRETSLLLQGGGTVHMGCVPNAIRPWGHVPALVAGGGRCT